MKIRPFAKKDSKKVQALMEEFLIHARKSDSKQVLQFDDYRDKDKSAYSKYLLKHFSGMKKSRFLVAEDGSDILGFILGFTKDNRYNLRKKGGHIRSFFVTKKMRGKGVGKKLYSALVKWFKEKKCDFLELDVYDGNTAVKMYRKWGFVDNFIRMKKKI